MKVAVGSAARKDSTYGVTCRLVAKYLHKAVFYRTSTLSLIS